MSSNVVARGRTENLCSVVIMVLDKAVVVSFLRVAAPRAIFFDFLAAIT